jgi:hypothetical protein
MDYVSEAKAEMQAIEADVGGDEAPDWSDF